MARYGYCLLLGCCDGWLQLDQACRPWRLETGLFVVLGDWRVCWSLTLLPLRVPSRSSTSARKRPPTQPWRLRSCSRPTVTITERRWVGSSRMPAYINTLAACVFSWLRLLRVYNAGNPYTVASCVGVGGGGHTDACSRPSQRKPTC